MFKNLKNYNPDDVAVFEAYIHRLRTEKNKDGTLKNYWATKTTDAKFEAMFKAVVKSGLSIDGKHITINTNGVSFDYVAYKNKMLMVYPESLIDVQLVYEGDEYSFSKDSGKVIYSHKIANPFGSTEDKIIGAYCVIKNQRGEFLTTLSRPEIDKHRKVAKQDYIWRAWFREMAFKTVIKKAVKVHYDDLYIEMENLDNEQYDLEKHEEKQELVPGTNHYVKVITAAKERGVGLAELKKHYIINKAAEAVITKELKG